MSINTKDLDPLIRFIYSIADDHLINTYEPSRYKDVILPMTVIRRLDLVLEPTKDRVIETYNKYKDKLDNLDTILKSDKQGSGVAFYNTSPFTLKSLLNDSTNLKANFINYLDGFSPNVQDIISRFKFRNEIDTLDEAEKLFSVIQKFCSSKIDLSMEALPPLSMGYVFEDLLRRFNEATNAEAGRHFTPREIIDLMTNIIFIPVKDKIQQGSYLVYDPCAGSGAMLTESKNFMTDENGNIKSKATIHLYGQENTPTIYAISKSDMLLKNEDPDKIVFGSTLSQYGFDNELKFDFMLTNPPYGTSWKDDKDILSKAGGGKIVDKRFIIQNQYDADAVTTRVNDGQLMFVMHMLSKMKDTELGSRIASVHNGSALFTGDAGQGESEIRKHIIEKDMLEAVIALPNDMFYNTGIPTFILIITNRKPEHRRGKVQLINANNEEFYGKRPKSLGSKRNELKPEHIKKVTDLFLDFKETEHSKIFDNNEFGFAQIIVHRPARYTIQLDTKHTNEIRFVADNTALRKLIYAEFGEQVYNTDAESKQAIENFVLDYFLNDPDNEEEEAAELVVSNLNKKQKKIFAQVTDVKSWLRDKQLMQDVITMAKEFGTEPLHDINAFNKKFKEYCKKNALKYAAKDVKDIRKCITWADKKAEAEIKSVSKDGTVNYISDSNLKDTENIPLKQDIQDFFEKEVLPFAPDAWWNPEETKIGYEINFNKYFYQYKAPRKLADIAKDIFEIEKSADKLLKEIVE